MKNTVTTTALWLAVALAAARSSHADFTTLDLSTGVDESNGTLLPDGDQDTSYQLTAPGSSAVPATVIDTNDFPIFPWGPWAESSTRAKWIGPAAPLAIGVAGDYAFERELTVPDWVPAGDLAIEGYWTADNKVVDVQVNGVSLGWISNGDYTALSPIPAAQPAGLFRTGLNTVKFVVGNAPSTNSSSTPIGLRIEAAAVIRNPVPCWRNLLPGSIYTVGSSFTDHPGRFTVGRHFRLDGTLAPPGEVRVDAGTEACTTNQAIRLNNSGITIDYGTPLASLIVRYGARGNMNLTINGAFANVVRPRLLPATLGGVQIDVVEMDGPSGCGMMRLKGYIETVALSGVEWAVSCLEPVFQPRFRRGDVNEDGVVDIADSAHLGEALFAGGPQPRCIIAADVNGEQIVNLADQVGILDWLFLGNHPPVAPGPFTCGPSPLTILQPPLGWDPACVYDQDCPIRPDAEFSSVELRWIGPSTVSGNPGEKFRVEARVGLCFERTAGTSVQIDDVNGWSFGVRRQGSGTILMRSATTTGTNFANPGFGRSDILNGGVDLVSAVIPNITPQPGSVEVAATGVLGACQAPHEILRVEFEARVPSTPGASMENSFHFADGIQGLGQPAPIRVAVIGRESGVPFGARSWRPSIGDPLTIRVVANNTPAGAIVTVEAGNGVTVTFREVTEGGMTTAEVVPAGPPPPAGFQVLDAAGGGASYYSVNTTVKYSGEVAIYFPYKPPPGMSESDQERLIRLMVHEPATGSWRDVTTSVDAKNHIICGRSHLSEFGLFLTRNAQVLFRRGDTNGDAQFDISDPISTLGFLFGGDKAPSCLDAADSNDDGTVDISDPVHSLGVLFLGEDMEVPKPGSRDCGKDPTEDLLTECNDSLLRCR